MFSRYRSYTCYSEENGKLVPSIEPTDNTTNTTNKINNIVNTLDINKQKKVTEEKDTVETK